ncbi:MAG: TolC family protein [Cyclobacteriaceae bacterium]
MLALAGTTTGLIGQEARTFNLEQCIEYAVENNPQLKIAELEVDISKASVGEYRSIGLPQITGDINFTQNLAIQTNFLSDFISPVTYEVLLAEGLIESIPAIDDTPIPAAFGTDYSARAGVQVSQLVFDGSYFVGLKAAATFQEVSAKEQIKTRIDVAEAVEKSYYAVLISQENLELLVTNYQRLDSLLNETQLLYDNGFAEKIDVNRIKIEYNNIQTNLKTSTESLVTIVAQLKFQMGMPVDEPLLLEGDLDQIKMEPIDADLSGFDYVKRIEYDILNTNKNLVSLDARRYKVAYMPNIMANFNAGFNSGTNNFSDITDFGNDQVWFDYSNWGLTMNIPIFDGLQKSYIIQQKKIELQQLDRNQRFLENSIDLEIMQSKINLNNNIERLNTQQENVELAKEVFDITRIKYQEGVGQNIEVIDADAAYKTAQLNYQTALYDALVARVELKKALGILMN